MMGNVQVWSGSVMDVGDGELVFSVPLEDVFPITLHGYGTADAAMAHALVSFAPHWPTYSERPLGPIQVRRIGRALDVWAEFHAAL